MKAIVTLRKSMENTKQTPQEFKKTTVSKLRVWVISHG